MFGRGLTIVGRLGEGVRGWRDAEMGQLAVHYSATLCRKEGIPPACGQCMSPASAMVAAVAKTAHHCRRGRQQGRALDPSGMLDGRGHAWACLQGVCMPLEDDMVLKCLGDVVGVE